MQKTNIFLKPDESKFLSLAVVSMLEQVTNGSKDVRINFNPQARKYLKEMVEAGTSLKIKMEKLGINMDELDPYNEGDELEFLTKQS